MEKDSKILVAGAKGMVGSAIVRRLEREGYTDICCAHRDEVNFTSQMQTNYFFKHNEFDYVFVAAAKVGGILANRDYKADVINDNLMIQTNIIRNAHKFGVKKLLFLGSSCIYPKESKLPITEDQLLTGPLETTNDAYAVAKIAGIKMCQSYHQQHGFNAISAMPCNLYGPCDNYTPEKSHVLPALIRRFHEAKVNGLDSVTCWGDGSPMREFLYVDDLADACVHLMNVYDDPQNIVNVGTGIDVTIRELTETVASVVGYTGSIEWDTSKPNGTMRKVMDVSRINDLGWKASTDLREGIELAYQWFKDNVVI